MCTRSGRVISSFPTGSRDGRNSSNEQTIYYWHGLDLLGQSDGTSAQYFQYDGLGSVRQLADSAGAVQYAQTFDPYGNLYASAGTSSSKLAYTGEYQDTNGLLFLRARYYNAQSGRFFQIDPSRQEKNPYLYGLANPIMRIDPGGLNPWCDYFHTCTPPRQGSGDVTQIPTYVDPFGLERNLDFEPSREMVLPTGTQYDITGTECSNNACGISSLSFITMNLPNNQGEEPKTLYDLLGEGVCLNDSGLLESQIVKVLDQITVDGVKKYSTEYLHAAEPSPGQEYPTQYQRFYDNVRVRYPNAFPVALIGHKGNDLDYLRKWCDIDGVAYWKCPETNRHTNGHFVVIAGLSAMDDWRRGEDWQWTRIYNPLTGHLEYHPAPTFFDWWVQGEEDLLSVSVNSS